MREVDVIELAPQMGPTTCFLNAVIFIKMMESGVGIRLQNAGEVSQMPLGKGPALRMLLCYIE